MEDSSKEHAVGYKRPPKSGQFRKGRSGNPGGRRRKNGPVRVDAATILDETFRVSIGGLTRSMSAKEIEIRQIYSSEDFGDALPHELREQEERLRQEVKSRGG